jgi:hypothetical protein
LHSHFVGGTDATDANKNNKTNSMKINSKKMGRTMRAARKLQAQYNDLGAASTQRVRNPISMPNLVKLVLPKAGQTIQANPIVLTPDARVLLGSTVVKAIEAFNRKVTKANSKRRGLTVRQVVAKLESKGFIAPFQHVAQTLSNAKHDPFAEIGSVQAPYEGQGRRFLYFMR